ncbi:MAG: hypothetical protein V1777_01940, partial [Candidatus Micrarchaeota archaeon]
NRNHRHFRWFHPPIRLGGRKFTLVKPKCQITLGQKNSHQHRKSGEVKLIKNMQFLSLTADPNFCTRNKFLKFFQSAMFLSINVNTVAFSLLTLSTPKTADLPLERRFA